MSDLKVEVVPIKYSTYVCDNNKNVWKLQNETPKNGKYYYSTTTNSMKGYRNIGSFTMHIISVSLLPSSPPIDHSSLLSSALHPKLIPFFKYLKSNSNRPFKPDPFHKEFLSQVPPSHEEHSKLSHSLTRTVIQRTIEGYCKNYEIAVREARYGEELVKEFLRQMEVIRMLMRDEKCEEWVAVKKERKEVTERIRKEMEEMEVKVDEEVRYEELTEKGRYLVDRVDSDCMRLVYEIEGMSLSYQRKYDDIDMKRAAVQGIIRCLSSLIYEHEMIQPFCCDYLNSYLAIEKIKYNWDMYDSKFEVNDLVMTPI